jgi:hypothetical protein
VKLALYERVPSPEDALRVAPTSEPVPIVHAGVVFASGYPEVLWIEQVQRRV